MTNVNDPKGAEGKNPKLHNVVSAIKYGAVFRNHVVDKCLNCGLKYCLPTCSY